MRPKVYIFRIFCELLAKTGLGSRINTGFLRGYRRNEVSPLEGIDTIHTSSSIFFMKSRNEVSPT